MFEYKGELRLSLSFVLLPMLSAVTVQRTVQLLLQPHLSQSCFHTRLADSSTYMKCRIKSSLVILVANSPESETTLDALSPLDSSHDRPVIVRSGPVFRGQEARDLVSCWGVKYALPYNCTHNENNQDCAITL